MKPADLNNDETGRSWFVVTADQRGSRRTADRVPEALAALAALPGRGRRLGFERTAGDEVQGLLDRPDAVVAAVHALTRQRDWRIGIGVGMVELPLPTSTRAGRGPAYLLARQAVDAARHCPGRLAVRAARPVAATRPSGGGGAGVARLVVEGGVGAAPYAEPDPAELAESGLWLLVSLLSRRTREGWQIVDLLSGGLTQHEAAASLGISASAVSQRLARAGHVEALRGMELAAHLLGRVGASPP